MLYCLSSFGSSVLSVVSRPVLIKGGECIHEEGDLDDNDDGEDAPGRLMMAL